MKQQLIVIQGATASGKTALAVELAKRLHTVVISADSRQFYKELEIGTAKPLPEEMDGIPHYFVDSHSILDPVSAARFEKEAMELIEHTLSDYPFIIVAGGSGMFIDALCNGLDPIPADEKAQATLREELKYKGLDAMIAELENADPEYAIIVDRSNAPRILRALEVYRISGIPFSKWRKNQPSPRPFDCKRFTIVHPREVLYDRINKRVDLMMQKGLLEEARSVEHLRELPPLQTVGYKECFDFFDGKYDLDECASKIRQHTRNYAKRQLTWFRKHQDAVEIPFSTTEQMSGEIINILKSSELRTWNDY